MAIVRTREVQVFGVRELDEMSTKIAPKVGRTLARAAVHAVAGKVRDRMRSRAKQVQGRAGQVIAKAITVKRRRGKPDEPRSDVIIQHGKSSRHDAFFWHWFEYGTAPHTIRSVKRKVLASTASDQVFGKVVRHPGITAQPFIRPTVEEMAPQIPALYREEFGKKLERKLAQEHKAQGVRT